MKSRSVAIVNVYEGANGKDAPEVRTLWVRYKAGLFSFPSTLTDARRGRNTQLPLPDLLRRSIYSRLAGYEDLNDAELLSQAPTFRSLGSEKIRDRASFPASLV